LPGSQRLHLLPQAVVDDGLVLAVVDFLLVAELADVDS